MWDSPLDPKETRETRVHQDPRAMRGPRGPRVIVVSPVSPAPRGLLVDGEQRVQKEVRVTKDQRGQLGRKEA